MSDYDYLKMQYENLEKMYIKDTNELRNEIDELKKERDQWKDRCLGAEAENIQTQRQLRHV